MRSIVVVRDGQVAASGRRDDGNYDEGRPSEEDGKVEYGYELLTISKCRL